MSLFSRTQRICSLAVMTATVPSYALASPTVTQGPVSIQAPSATWTTAFEWARLQERVAHWATLPEDWDGMEGTAPSASVLAAAGEFIDKLQVHGICLPEAEVAGDGEVTLSWAKGDNIATVSFLADGHIVAFASREGARPLKVDRPYSDYSPRELFDQLSRFA
jgi:hypothetical protein